jgi:hypothetical protein
VATYEAVHAGDVVLGHDGAEWSVEAITHRPRLEVTLARYGHRVTGWPPEGTHVTVVRPSDTTAEVAAADALIGAGLGPVGIISERWES